MRAWRKAHSSVLESECFSTLSDGAGCLFFMLVVAQDDSGYYPWETAKIKRLIVGRPWSVKEAMTFAQELTKSGIAAWEEGGIVLHRGEELNGQPRKDVTPELYLRNETATSRDGNAPLEQSRVEENKSRVEKNACAVDDGFNQFWEAYPRKIAKAIALKAWTALAPGLELQATILAAVERHKQTDQWVRDGGTYIPHPASWLRAKRWEDEVTVSQGGNNGRTTTNGDGIARRRPGEADPAYAEEARRLGQASSP